jgi:hypothetical protein
MAEPGIEGRRRNRRLEGLIRKRDQFTMPFATVHSISIDSEQKENVLFGE